MAKECLRKDGTRFTKGVVRVEWVNLGEGLDGDYDPNDPQDIPLLRFDVYRLDSASKTWDAVDDSSYCTRFPTTATTTQMQEGLMYLMDFFYEPVRDNHSVKKLGERMSWIGLDWLNKKI